MLFRHSLPSSMGAWGLALSAKSKLKNESPDKQKRKEGLTLKLGSWNVRTMTTGMDTEIDNTSAVKINCYCKQ